VIEIGEPDFAQKFMCIVAVSINFLNIHATQLSKEDRQTDGLNSSSSLEFVYWLEVSKALYGFVGAQAHRVDPCETSLMLVVIDTS